MPVPRPIPKPPPKGWWVELSFDRWAAGIAADIRDARQANEQAKRLRRLRRRVERLDEMIVLAESASEARQALRRRGIPYDSRTAVPGEVEHFTRPGRILSVR